MREVLKHDSIERAVLVDIDSTVIELSKKYFPNVSNGAFDDPRVKVIVDDASQFVKSSKETFDVIICDSSDALGPSAVLYTKDFYGDCKALLREKGILVNMSGVPFLQKEEMLLTYRNRLPHFKNVGFYVAPVPTYAGGFLAIGWATDFDYEISEEILREKAAEISDPLFYYTPAIHKGSFALPNFMVKCMEEN